MTGVAEALAALDDTRRATAAPDGPFGVVRAWWPDAAACQVVRWDCPDERLGDMLGAERRRADAGGYELEWKVYGHDCPPALPDLLQAHGFQPGDLESVLCLGVGEAAAPGERPWWRGFAVPGAEVRGSRDDEAVLADAAAVSAQVDGDDAAAALAWLTALAASPDEDVSVHVATVDGRPVAGGRLHVGPPPAVAYLAGGGTVESYRGRGLFTAVVAARLREAERRGCRSVLVDALPTSEPILRRRGFVHVTTTRPYVYRPGPAPG